VPLGKILSNENHGLPKDKQIVLHCASGSRSQQAAEHLAKHGYTQVQNLRGGIRAWQAVLNRR
jgi:rhodanese-related sulfurtransferase